MQTSRVLPFALVVAAVAVAVGSRWAPLPVPAELAKSPATVTPESPPAPPSVVAPAVPAAPATPAVLAKPAVPAAPVVPHSRTAKRARIAGTPAPASQSEAPVATGMVVGIDPETGRFGLPTPDQMKKLFPPGARMEQTTEGFVIEERADGTVLLHVGSALQEYSFARVGPDGKVIRDCATAARGAHGLTELPTTTPIYEEK